VQPQTFLNIEAATASAAEKVLGGLRGRVALPEAKAADTEIGVPGVNLSIVVVRDIF
jgi:hypothetical protein